MRWTDIIHRDNWLVERGVVVLLRFEVLRFGQLVIL